MAENVKLAENVILVDVAYFNDVVKDLKRYFELQLGRPLQNIYVEEWASYKGGETMRVKVRSV
ncbi:hypothetical protein [Bacteroides cellulosilyticus]|uniref:hypothetical protein n=1 Tax=Bacteroides cellulosilyticus TaxID=246787 RepID=UPI0032EC8472